MACQCQGECMDCAHAAELEALDFASLAATDPGTAMDRDDWECEQGAIDRLHDIEAPAWVPEVKKRRVA